MKRNRGTRGKREPLPDNSGKVQDASTSDVFHPDWKPGAKSRGRIARRMENEGISYSEALEIERADLQAKVRLHYLKQHRDREETEADRRKLRQEKREVFPEPKSVRAILTAVETNRRKH